MEFREVVRRRRMVRRFDRRPVPPEIVDRIVDVGRRAPSAGFSQGLEVLQDTKAAAGMVGSAIEETQEPHDERHRDRNRTTRSTRAAAQPAEEQQPSRDNWAVGGG